ncbi:uncharacterized protein LOC132390216 [Hypanus sabinus]|uniref:uncharacterized protein LOC132390216 n=1 Tax=Hypanus sabinus TaxID=79690 RepID=UPI0028C40FCC|nr:uncharacterized protein LOC132390216 [Hypanus sabinus]
MVLKRLLNACALLSVAVGSSPIRPGTCSERFIGRKTTTEDEGTATSEPARGLRAPTGENPSDSEIPVIQSGESLVKNDKEFVYGNLEHYTPVLLSLSRYLRSGARDSLDHPSCSDCGEGSTRSSFLLRLWGGIHSIILPAQIVGRDSLDHPSCSDCGEGFTRSSFLLRLWGGIHSIILPAQTVGRDSLGHPSCSDCGEGFTRSSFPLRLWGGIHSIILPAQTVGRDSLYYQTDCHACHFKRGWWGGEPVHLLRQWE